jgi:hypothetical protein
MPRVPDKAKKIANPGRAAGRAPVELDDLDVDGFIADLLGTHP